MSSETDLMDLAGEPSQGRAKTAGLSSRGPLRQRRHGTVRGTMVPDEIVAFFSGGRDDRGRTLDEILAWDDERLEEVHDYIQWLFPTRQPSGVNPFAPVVTPVTQAAFAENPHLGVALGRALDRLLRFYGLRRSEMGIEKDVARFGDRAQVWLHPGNHNHLRLTRIMDSLSSLGRRDDAIALQRCLLEEICAGPDGRLVAARTIEFWRRAVDS